MITYILCRVEYEVTSTLVVTVMSTDMSLDSICTYNSIRVSYNVKCTFIINTK